MIINYLHHLSKTRIRHYEKIEDESEYKKKFTEPVTQIILDVLFDTNTRLDDKDKFVFIERVLRNICLDFKDLSIDDVKSAFREGVMGDYRKISVIELTKWLSNYKNEYNNQLRARAKPETYLPKQEQDEVNAKGAAEFHRVIKEVAKSTKADYGPAPLGSQINLDIDPVLYERECKEIQKEYISLEKNYRDEHKDNPNAVEDFREMHPEDRYIRIRLLERNPGMHKKSQH